ncbi:hypothetical protein ACMFMG_003074 [Clarireedia jacksonii]
MIVGVPSKRGGFQEQPRYDLEKIAAYDIKKFHLFPINEDSIEVVRSSGMSMDARTLRDASRVQRRPWVVDTFAKMKSRRWAHIILDVAVLGFEVAGSSQVDINRHTRNQFERLGMQQEDLRSFRCQLVTSTSSFNGAGRPVPRRVVQYRDDQPSQPFIESFDMPKRARKVTWLNKGDISEPLLYSYTKPRNHREVWIFGPVPLICNDNGIPKTQGKYEGLERTFTGENIDN